MTRPKVVGRTMTNWAPMLFRPKFLEGCTINPGRAHRARLQLQTASFFAVGAVYDRPRFFVQNFFRRDSVKRLILAVFCMTAAVAPALGQKGSLADLIQA